MNIKDPLLYLLILFSTKEVMSQLPDGVKKFSLHELLATRAQQKQSWYQFLNEETMSAGVYFLKAGENDNQAPHEFDEVYYILSGKASLKADEKIISVSKGSIVYVKAQVEHHFFDIAEDITAVVVFSKATPNAADTTARVYNLHDIEATGKPAEVVWTPFLRCRTMVFGLYMMPKPTGGDSTQIHTIDEINIVTKGSSKFSVDANQLDVREGDIVYVRKKQGHYFHDLNSDLNVLILFEKKSLQK